jgi:type VI protein secretion system component Hcp
VVLVLCLSVLASPASAQIELFAAGESQGPIEPQSPSEASVERRMLAPIPIESFSLSVSQYYDQGDPDNPSGPRVASPLFLAKKVDATTTKFLRALANSEELTTCFLHVSVPDATGGSQVVLELTLDRAYVLSGNVGSSVGSASSEAISIGYETLEWYNPVTGERFTETMGSSSVDPVPGSQFALRTTPNPTAGDTQFTFRLPASGAVSIDVYDFRGRHIVTVFDGDAPAEDGGVVSWNGLDSTGLPVASGVYLVRMRVGSWLTTHKMSVLR